MSTSKYTLTKDQWQKIETELSSPYGNVKLRCDGYEITASIQRLKPLQSCIAVYVDGWIKGEWMNGKDERALKFYCEKKRFLWSVQNRSEAKKKLLNRRLGKFLKDFYKKMVESSFSVWEPYWTSPKAFCRHIRKTCQSIELVKTGFVD
ncbi:hypothetical protein [Nitrosovibrio sp. Nv4]|uniref:hypothetical protein n=1 Tax=Nitrosovibrio sp. Nv4 TaxID=1945880 RepID=UPI000BCE7956|nr:hypothetical protein [Nitrosovibrio sp. Nv4]SOD42308.1 hypothetical protein SAMN06298226_2646 [Nitrosovibrio sp. Nv4]